MLFLTEYVPISGYSFSEFYEACFNHAKYSVSQWLLTYNINNYKAA